jgi:hypothetical protein
VLASQRALESRLALTKKRGAKEVAGAPNEGGNPTMASYIGAIDQGTTSSRFIVFDRPDAS